GFSQPVGIAADAAGRIYIADSGNTRIRRIDTDSVVSTVAGNGGYRNAPDGTPAAGSFLLTSPGLALRNSGALVIADTGNARIRLVESGGMRTIAGSGVRGCCFPERPATEDLISDPASIVEDRMGNLIFSDLRNTLIRSLSPEGK